jgi:hypothetical protein
MLTALFVPGSVLSKFHGDVFPAGIRMRDGTGFFNIVVSSVGAERILVIAFAEN